MMVDFIARLLGFPAAVYALNLIFLFTNSYWLWPWLDIPMHIVGGASIGVSAQVLLRESEKRRWLHIRSRVVRAFFVVAIVAFVAVVWEVYELLSDTFLGTGSQLGVPDTVADQIFGLSGGAFSLVWFFGRRRK